MHDIYNDLHIGTLRTSNIVDPENNYLYLKAINDYFYNDTIKGYTSSSNITSWFKSKKMYIPSAYKSLFNNYGWMIGGFRNNYILTYYSAYVYVNGFGTNGYQIYIYDYENDILHDFGYFTKTNPNDSTDKVDLTKLQDVNYRTTNGQYAYLGQSFLDDLMYSNKSTDILVYMLYLFIPLFLFILLIKVFRKGLFK